MRRIALVNDLSGYGKCSLNTQIPIISAFGDSPYSLLTSYLSNNTSYKTYYKVDMKEEMRKIIAAWKENDFKFDAIITGYIENEDNIDDVIEFIKDQKLMGHTFVLSDPAFADNGALYKGMTEKHIEGYKKIMKLSDIITPNLSEACLLSEVDYEKLRVKFGLLKYDAENKQEMEKTSKTIVDALKEILDKIVINKKQITIITGIELFNAVVTILDVVDGDKDIRQTTCNYATRFEDRPGTGDLFDAYFLETFLNGYSLVDCLSITTTFIKNALKFTEDQRFKKEEGVIFEPVLVSSINFLRDHTKRSDGPNDKK